MIDNDKTQAMFMFVLLSTLLILSGIRTVGDGLNRNSPRSPSAVINYKSIHGRALYTEPVFYGGFVQPPQRRLLEHPRRAKQIYRSHDYNVARGYRQSRNKLDEDEDEEEEEEEENQNDEEDKLDDESANEEIAEQDEEETVNEEPNEVYDYG